jgi:hypothetical protein
MAMMAMACLWTGSEREMEVDGRSLLEDSSRVYVQRSLSFSRFLSWLENEVYLCRESIQTSCRQILLGDVTSALGEDFQHFNKLWDLDMDLPISIYTNL